MRAETLYWCLQKRSKAHLPMSVASAAKPSFLMMKLYSVSVIVSSGCTAIAPAPQKNSLRFFMKTTPRLSVPFACCTVVCLAACYWKVTPPVQYTYCTACHENIRCNIHIALDVSWHLMQYVRYSSGDAFDIMASHCTSLVLQLEQQHCWHSSGCCLILSKIVLAATVCRHTL